MVTVTWAPLLTGQDSKGVTGLFAGIKFHAIRRRRRVLVEWADVFVRPVLGPRPRLGPRPPASRWFSLLLSLLSSLVVYWRVVDGLLLGWPASWWMGVDAATISGSGLSLSLSVDQVKHFQSLRLSVNCVTGDMAGSSSLRKGNTNGSRRDKVGRGALVARAWWMMDVSTATNNEG